MKTQTLWLNASVATIAVVCLIQNAIGHGMIPQNTPVDRLIENLTKYIKEHPDDPTGYYRLGRVHTLALETQTGFVLAFPVREGEPARPAEGSWAKRHWMQGPKEKPVPPDQKQVLIHLTEAVRLLNKVIEMRPNEAIYRLTLASALEAGEPFMNEVDVWPLVPKVDTSKKDYYREQLEQSLKDPSVVDELIELMRHGAWSSESRDIVIALAYERRDVPEYKAIVEKLRTADWREQIENQLFTAMCDALPTNGKATEKPIWGGMEDWVSYEAGKEFIRVVEDREQRKGDAIRLRVAKETVKAFDDLPPPGGITPVVVDFAGRSLTELVSNGTVKFDLDGSGRKQSWTWVKPDVGILVWDPQGTGQITSGRQLFGSVSWRLFFENGYQALDLLDDNRDGQLSGAELNGLALWFDRNENGVSDVGEVKSVARHNVERIACRATAFDGQSPMNARGLRTTNGTTHATYDWISHVRASSQSNTYAGGSRLPGCGVSESLLADDFISCEKNVP